MTSQERAYLRDLADGFGMREADAVTLARVYGVAGPPGSWTTEQVEQAAAIIKANGPDYERVKRLGEQADAEWKASVARTQARQKRAA